MIVPIEVAGASLGRVVLIYPRSRLLPPLYEIVRGTVWTTVLVLLALVPLAWAWGAAAPDEPGISRKHSWERTRRPGIGVLPRILRVYPPDLHRITSATTVASTSASMAINAAV